MTELAVKAEPAGETMDPYVAEGETARLVAEFGSGNS